MLFNQKAIAFSLSLFMSFAVMAGEEVLCEVTNDVDKETGKMVYEYDEATRSITHLYKDRYVNNQRINREELNPEDLLGEGIVLNRKDKYVTVRMYSHNFDVLRGGVLYLDTLYNGVNGERKEYSVQVSIAPGAVKMLYNAQEVNKMHFVAKRSRVLGVIGIEKVLFSKK